MTVKEIPVNIRCLEYRQDKADMDYGSCLYARFYFNLDKYELNIISDVGNYDYQWFATPEHESFLELMARISDDYLLGKLCGSPTMFDYESTYEYTAWQKKIVSVFKNHIQPVIREIIKAEVETQESEDKE